MTISPSGRPATYVGRVRRLVASSPKRERLFFSGYVNRTAGAAIAVLVESTRVTPNILSVAGLAVHVIAASMLVLSPAPISGPSWIALLVLWQLAFSLDGADGQLARLRGGGSAFGAWLDTSADVVTHVLVYGALGVFVVRTLGLDGPASALFTGAVLGTHLIQLLTAWRHTILGSEPSVPHPPRWLALSMGARHLLDYGWFLFVSAALLPWPRLLAVFLLLSGLLHLLAFISQLGLNWYRDVRSGPTAGAAPRGGSVPSTPAPDQTGVGQGG